MTRHNNFKSVFALFFLLFVSNFAFSEINVNNQYGFLLDIPEGYNLDDSTPDGKSFLFTHPNIPVTFVIKVYDDEGYMYSQEALETTLTKLSATFEADSFMWNGTECAISNFEMILDQQYSGWSVATKTDNNTYLTLLCYAPKKDAPKCQEFMLSTINSLCIDDYYYNTPGIITTFVFPSEGQQEITTNVAGAIVKSKLDKVDREASQFVVDIEYKILTYYAQHHLWKEAWERYYRILYRDSYGRLTDFAKNAYDTLYPIAEKVNPKNPQIQYAQYLLTWIQSVDYTRAEDKKDSDFTSLPAILLGESSDCDSRSLMICTLLEYAGIDTLLLISPEYSHALVAADIKAPGQTFHNKENNTDYIIGETTAKVTWGMIAQNQADRTKWFAVSLP